MGRDARRINLELPRHATAFCALRAMLRIGYTAAPAACVQEEYGKQMTVAVNQASGHSVRASREKIQSFISSFPEFLIITLKRQLDRIYKIYRIIGNQRLANHSRGNGL